MTVYDFVVQKSLDLVMGGIWISWEKQARKARTL